MGFEYDNALLSLRTERQPDGTPMGVTRIFGAQFDTTGVLGLSTDNGKLTNRAFPSWATIPSYRSLAGGRTVHFFFAWVFAGAFALWLVSSLINGHLRRNILPGRADLAGLPRAVLDHLRLRLHHDGRNNPLQKLSYFVVLLVLFPLVILTGLSMSPAMNAAVPWLPELFGGRQSARSLHFLAMVLLVAFFVIHLVMVLAAGPFNEMRSMITGWYRTRPEPEERS